jgi:hypothetical protein
MQDDVKYFNNNVSDKIINDPIFKESVINSLKNITADDVIDQHDIPEMVIMVIEIYNNIGKFKIQKEDFVTIMTDVLCKIIDEYKLVKDDQKINIKKLISSALRLATMKIKYDNIKCHSWNCFKSNKN